MLHVHVTTWFVAIILLFVSYNMQKNGKQKPAKITKMILRLFYILILATGGHLFGLYASALGAGILQSAVFYKALAGLWVIVAMELLLVKQAKGKSTELYWIQFAIALLIALFFGYIVL
ncbi:MAG TPA: YisL family protein [Bacillus bacterium]|nr:YisL family protein [Bacillus sp. (in: firmicutes)]